MVPLIFHQMGDRVLSPFNPRKTLHNIAPLLGPQYGSDTKICAFPHHTRKEIQNNSFGDAARFWDAGGYTKLKIQNTPTPNAKGDATRTPHHSVTGQADN